MKDLNTDKTIIIGIGNYGRRDDGLGWRFLDLLEKSGYTHDMEYRYQLQIEDAQLISAYDNVIFVDACVNNMDTHYSFSTLEKEYSLSPITHSISPGQLMFLCAELYGSCPEANVLAIRGYAFGLENGLSDEAEESLQAAYDGIKAILLRL